MRLIDSSADAPGDGREEICARRGQEVNVFFTTDLEATADAEQPGVSECLRASSPAGRRSLRDEPGLRDRPEDGGPR